MVFEPNLPLPDMKARLVLNRLGARGRVLKTHPPADQLDEVESLSEFTVWLAAECEPDELRALADVDGVARIRIEPAASTQPQGNPSGTEPTAAARVYSLANAPAVPSLYSLPPMPKPSMPPPPLVRVPPSFRTRTRPSPAANLGAAAPRPQDRGEPRKAKVAETIRVESDRLDYLMNLAGELVINKARFVNIAKGLEELFRGSNAQALATDTEERLESITRGWTASSE